MIPTDILQNIAMQQLQFERADICRPTAETYKDSSYNATRENQHSYCLPMPRDGRTVFYMIRLVSEPATRKSAISLVHCSTSKLEFQIVLHKNWKWYTDWIYSQMEVNLKILLGW